MGSIGVRSLSRAEVGVATSSGKSYYVITSLLKHARIPYVDVLFGGEDSLTTDINNAPFLVADYESGRLKLIITTRKERLQVLANTVICIEDLGEDWIIAKQKLLSILHPLKESDRFVVGIDPGQRTGIAAFMNHIEVDSDVLGSIDDTVIRAKRLLDNAPKMKKIVKIGSGMPALAERIAFSLDSIYERDQIRIQLVDERGTSSLYASGKSQFETRDQRSAKLIAFREGRDYVPNASIMR
ncbi:MAG: hypothetical protein PXY39_01405 [archaeon]|nr:hypothetical protein [archaeon]